MAKKPKWADSASASKNAAYDAYKIYQAVFKCYHTAHFARHGPSSSPSNHWAKAFSGPFAEKQLFIHLQQKVDIEQKKIDEILEFYRGRPADQSVCNTYISLLDDLEKAGAAKRRAQKQRSKLEASSAQEGGSKLEASSAQEGGSKLENGGKDLRPRRRVTEATIEAFLVALSGPAVKLLHILRRMKGTYKPTANRYAPAVIVSFPSHNKDNGDCTFVGKTSSMKVSVEVKAWDGGITFPNLLQQIEKEPFLSDTVFFQEALASHASDVGKGKRKEEDIGGDEEDALAVDDEEDTDDDEEEDEDSDGGTWRGGRD
ncbi:hypothetical protein NMY22_g19227 [Coprinellus aureogranulatus]|nr:hypothetical protein NMY22_g19227 [Coprinellus aureogranulatus]